MADINDYVEGLDYHFTEQEKQLMDIFAECWEYCHAHGCNNCEYRNGNEYIKMMICLSYQYAQRLIAAGLQKVKHGKWIEYDNGVQVCSECGEEHEWYEYRACYCEDCGAKMEAEMESEE